MTCTVFILSMYAIPSGHDTCLFYLHYSGTDAMGGSLERINQDKIKYDTSLNSCRPPPSLEESRDPDSMSIVASENLGIEWNNDIMVETAESDDGIMKPSSSSRMRG